MDEKKLTPTKAIRQNCIECCCGDKNEVKLCPVVNCPLYPFRLGHNPNVKKKEITDDQRAALAERLKNSRQSREKK